jgi:hypothetical protein
MASKWDQFFGQQWNQNKQYDPLMHGLLESIAGHDSDRIGDFAHAIGWDWLEKEADKNSATPERAIGRAALTAGAIYGVGAMAGAGGGGAAGGVAGGEAGAAAGLGAGEAAAYGGYGAGNAFGDAAVFGASSGGGEAAAAAGGGLLGDGGYGAGNAFGDEAVFGSQQGGLLGDGGYVPWEDGFQGTSANPVGNDPSTGMGQQLGQFGNSTQQTGDKLAGEEEQRRAEARNSLRNGGELRGNRGEKLDAAPFLYGRFLRPGRKA